jgi:hypothetical protein
VRAPAADGHSCAGPAGVGYGCVHRVRCSSVATRIAARKSASPSGCGAKSAGSLIPDGSVTGITRGPSV